MDIYRSSFSLYSFDINQIIVSSIPRFILINQEVEFTIDVSNAGEGQLQIEINNGQVHHQIHKIADRKFRVRFTPVARDRHLISIKFNDQQLPGKDRLKMILKPVNFVFKAFPKNVKSYLRMTFDYIVLISH